MKTITDITIAATTDNAFAIDYDLDGYEGNCEMHTVSGVRIFVEDTVSFAVDREARKVISENVADLLDDGAVLITVDVLDLRTEGGYFDAVLHWMHHGVTYSKTLSF